MKVFLDANILVSVLNKEYPIFSYTSRILSLADNRQFELFTTPLCLAIAFYFSEKKCGTQLSKKKIELLSSKLSIADVGKQEVLKSISDKRVTDFEDGLEYYAALNHQCNVIVTEDISDFYYSDISVLNSKRFIEKLIKNLL